VSIRLRIILGFLLIVGVSFYFFLDWMLDDVKVRYREATEEPLVDTAYLLASILSSEAEEGELRFDSFRTALKSVGSETFSAEIYDLLKTRVDTRIYVTDKNGVVIFDSAGGKAEGEDYSRWNDVYLTLKGKYGARSTRRDPNDPASAVFHVAAPIKLHGEIAGVVTVCKPLANVNLFIRTTRKNILLAGLIAGVSVIALGILVSVFFTRPIGKLTGFARAIRDGKRASLPRLGKNEIGMLGEAMAEMREALEGKKYVEQYVQTLAHEIKSPLSAINGSAELLEEDMPPERRARFLLNIRIETTRIKEIIARLLELASLENRRTLEKTEEFDPAVVIEEVVESLHPLLQAGEIAFSFRTKRAALIYGERFLIRQAIENLLRNAIEFTPPGGEIRVELLAGEDSVSVVIEDSGSGIPDYALDKVFKKFYSLPRPGTSAKSTGLGLSFVREAATLHGGHASLENRSPRGVRAVLTLPY